MLFRSRALLNFVNYLTPGRDPMADGYLKEAEAAIERSGFTGSYIESYAQPERSPEAIEAEGIPF